jgi:hypothetical protein
MHSLYARMLFICFVAAITTISWSALAQRITKPRALDYAAPPLSFFEDCVFVCVDIQEGGEGPVTSIPDGWKKIGGHTNPGGCLGQTAKSARERGYTILCIEDATFDAGESTRIPGIAAVPFHYVMRTREFVKLAKEAQATQFLKP